MASPNWVDDFGVLRFTAESAESAEEIKENLRALCVLCGEKKRRYGGDYLMTSAMKNGFQKFPGQHFF